MFEDYDAVAVVSNATSPEPMYPSDALVKGQASFSRPKCLPDGSYQVKLLAAEELRQVMPLTTDDVIPTIRVTDFIVKSNFTQQQEVVLSEWNTQTFSDVPVRTNLRSDQSTIRCPSFNFLVAEAGEVHIICFELINSQDEVVAWMELTGDKVGPRTRFLRLPPVEPAKACEKPHLRVIGPGVDVEIAHRSASRRELRAHSIAGDEATMGSPAGSFSGEGIEFRNKANSMSPGTIPARAQSPMSPGVDMTAAAANPSPSQQNRRRRSTKQPTEVPVPLSFDGGQLPQLSRQASRSPTLVDPRMQSKSPGSAGSNQSQGDVALPVISKETSRQQLMSRAVTIAVDGLVGLPLNVVCTRVRAFVADSVDPSTGQLAGATITAEELFTDMRLSCCQDVHSSTTEPKFPAAANCFQCFVGNLTSVVVVVDCALKDGKGWVTIGHAVLPAKSSQAPGRYMSRIRLGDPSPFAAENREEAARLRTALQQQPAADDFIPLAKIKWRKDAEPTSGPYAEEPQGLFPETSFEQHQREMRHHSPLAAPQRTPATAARVSSPAEYAALFEQNQFREEPSEVLSFLAPHEEKDDIFLNIECLLGAPLVPKALYKVVVELVTSADPFSSTQNRIGFTSQHNFKAPLIAPMFLEDPVVFPNVPHQPQSFFLIRLFSVDTTQQGFNGIQEVGWTVTRLFLDDNFVRHGRLVCPLFDKQLPPGVLEELRRPGASLDDIVLRHLQDGKISFTSPRILVRFAQGYWGRVIEVSSKRGPYSVCKTVFIKHISQDKLARFEIPPTGSLSKPLSAMFGSSGDSSRIQHEVNGRFSDFLRDKITLLEPLRPLAKAAEAPDSAAAVTQALNARDHRLMSFNSFQAKAAAVGTSSSSHALPPTAPAPPPDPTPAPPPQPPKTNTTRPQPELLQAVPPADVFGQKFTSPLLSTPVTPAKDGPTGFSANNQTPAADKPNNNTTPQRSTAQTVDGPSPAAVAPAYSPAKPTVPRLRSAGATRSNSFAAAPIVLPNQQVTTSAAAAAASGPPPRARAQSVAGITPSEAPFTSGHIDGAASAPREQQPRPDGESPPERARSSSVLGGGILRKFRDQVNNDVMQQESNLFGAANPRVLLNIDGIVGLPFSFVVTRITVFVADRADPTKQLTFNDHVRDVNFFNRAPDFFAYQDTSSPCSEPTFSANSQFVSFVGDKTLAVVIVEGARADKTWATIGHSVLLISDFLQAGRFRSRVRAGDPRESSELQKDLSRRVVHLADYVPTMFVRWRRNTEFLKNAKDDAGWELPLTESEKLLAEDRSAFPNRKFPWNYQIVSAKDIPKMFDAPVPMQQAEDASQFAKFNKGRNVFIKVEGLSGIVLSALQLQALMLSAPPSGSGRSRQSDASSGIQHVMYKVEVELFGQTAIAQKNDFTTHGVTFSDSPFAFTEPYYEPTVFALFRVFAVTLGKGLEGQPTVTFVAWTVMKLFVDAYYLRNGRVALPLFVGECPSKEVLETESHSTEDLILALATTANPPCQLYNPGVLLRVAVGDSARSAEVTSRRGVHVGSKLLIPAGPAWAGLFEQAAAEDTFRRVVTAQQAQRGAGLNVPGASSNTALFGVLTAEQDLALQTRVQNFVHSYRSQRRHSHAPRPPPEHAPGSSSGAPSALPAQADKDKREAAPRAPSVVGISPAVRPTKAKKVPVVIDGLTGLPLQSTCSRCLVYFADLESTSSSIPVTAEALFDKPPEIITYQDLQSLVAEPKFSADNSWLAPIGPVTRAVVIIELSFGKSWSTYGHAVIPIGWSLTANSGAYFTRLRPGDPRKPRASAQDVEDHSAIQRSRLGSVPQSPDEYLPLALLRWRRDCSDANATAEKDPSCTPLTQMENMLHKERLTIGLKRTPAICAVQSIADAKQSFDDSRKAADSGDATSYISPYVPERSCFVCVERISGMFSDSNPPADVLFKVLVRVGDSVGFTQMHDMTAPYAVPTFVPEPITFTGVPNDDYLCAWFTIFTVNVKTKAIRPVAWSVAKLFVEQHFLRQARISIPLFEGNAPPPAFAKELASQPIEQTVIKHLFSNMIKYHPSRSLLQIAQGDSARFPEITARYPAVPPAATLGPYINQSKWKLIRKTQLGEFEKASSAKRPGGATLQKAILAAVGKDGAKDEDDQFVAVERNMNEAVLEFLQNDGLEHMQNGTTAAPAAEAAQPAVQRRPSFFARLFS